ncbi:MAG: hypothetical protein HC802_04225 [Caldilineaceae bacterium]|nr:hypothetical protein [Caldilineaceae bacterium]
MTSQRAELVQRYERELNRTIATKPEFIAGLDSALQAHRGYAAGKIGVSEKQWLLYKILLDTQADRRQQFAHEQLLAQHWNVQSGLFPVERAFYARFTEAYVEHLLNLNCLGLFFDLPDHEMRIIHHFKPPAALVYFGDQEPDRSSPADDSRCYLPLFANKRLLLVSPYASFLRDRANEATFTRVWAKTGKGWFWPASVDALEFPYGYEQATQAKYGTALDLFDEIVERMSRLRFDIALIGAGGLGIPLASAAKKMGKVGLSLGGHLQTIFGVNGKRWRHRKCWQRRYFNEWWVDLPASYRPSTKQVSDGGAYW